MPFPSLDLPSLDEIREAVMNTDISSVPIIIWERVQGTVSVAQSTSADIYDSLNRYGAPAFPSLKSTPLPPPPPVVKSLPASTYDRASKFVSSHPVTTAATTTAIIGGIALVGLGKDGRNRLYYTLSGSTPPPSSGRRLISGKSEAIITRPIKGKDGYRKEAIVILGADATPLGFPLALHLEQKGFIVVCSVSSLSAVEELEGKAKGYLRALILDPLDSKAVPAFVRSLQSVLTLRFPINVPGDPYPPANLLPSLTSVISCLSLPIPSPTSLTTAGSSSSPNLQPSVFTPLSVVTALVPALKSSRSPTKSVIALLPAQGSLAIPYHSGMSIATAAANAAFDVLSRELKMDAHGRQVNVKMIDVGVVSEKESELSLLASSDKKKTLRDVIVSVKKTFSGSARKGSGVEVLQKKVYKAIIKGNSPLNWWFGGRSSVGSGSWTYTLFAPLLPSPFLTFLLSLSFRGIGPVIQQQQLAAFKATSAAPPLPTPPLQQQPSIAQQVPAPPRSIGSGYGGSSENGESRESSDMEESWIDARRV